MSGLDQFVQTHGNGAQLQTGPVKTDVFITPTDEKHRKWTNKVSLSALNHRPRGDG